MKKKWTSDVENTKGPEEKEILDSLNKSLEPLNKKLKNGETVYADEINRILQKHLGLGLSVDEAYWNNYLLHTENEESD